MFIDLSHTIEDGLITYKGLPAPVICDFLSREASRRLYAPGTEFHIGRIEMVANTGTYLDSPFHRFADGKDLSALPLEKLADLEVVVVRWDAGRGRAIGSRVFEGRPLRGKAVLVHTGWSAHWRTDRYFEGHPFLTRDAAEYLREAGASMVGIDSYNIDDTDDMTRPVDEPVELDQWDRCVTILYSRGEGRDDPWSEAVREKRDSLETLARSDYLLCANSVDHRGDGHRTHGISDGGSALPNIHFA